MYTLILALKLAEKSVKLIGLQLGVTSRIEIQSSKEVHKYTLNTAINNKRYGSFRLFSIFP